MTSHETYRDQLLDLAYGELGKREARALRAHLETCPGCRTELERMTATRGAMSALPAEPAPERGEAVLLAAAREATRDRRRPWLPSWVWGTSIGVVGVAAVALVAVRLSGALRPPAAQRDRDALVSRSVQEEEPRLEAPPAADSAPSAAAAAEPARPAPPPAVDVGAAGPFKSVPAPKGELARRKEAAAPVTSQRALADRLGATAGVAPRSAPPQPASPPVEAEFAQPPPPAQAPAPSVAATPAPAEPMAGGSLAAPEDRQDARERADDKDLATRDEKRVAAAPAASGAGLVGAKVRAAKAAIEDPVARYERLRAAGKLRAASAGFRDCAGEAWRQVETDEQGRVVKVTRRGVHAGTPYQAEQFYREDGQLGAVRWRSGGASRELRLGGPGAEAASTAAGVPASALEPARAAEAGLDAPPRCQE